MAYSDRKLALSGHILASLVWFLTHLFELLTVLAAVSFAIAMVNHSGSPLYGIPMFLKILLGLALIVYRGLLWWTVVRLWSYPLIFLWVDAALAIFPNVFGMSIVFVGFSVWFDWTPPLLLRLILVLVGVAVAYTYRRIVKITITDRTRSSWDILQV